MNSKALIVGVSLFAGTLGSIDAGTAHADTFITSGVSCVPLNPANFSLLQYSADGVSNPSTVAVDVICPITHNAATSSNLEIEHTFDVNNPANCTALGIDASTGQQTGTFTFRLGGGPRFNMPSTFVIPPGVTAHLLVRCRLPARFRTPDGALRSLIAS